MKNKLLYSLQGIACIMVILIHSRFPGVIGYSLNAIARFAVPLFFIISGYFTYTADTKKLLKKMLHITKLFILSFGVYVLYTYFLCRLNNNIQEFSNTISCMLMKENILKLAILNVVPLANHLWYLPALLYCYIFRLITKNKILSKSYILAPFVLVGAYIYAIISIYNNTFENIYIRNWMFFGVPLFCIGCEIKKLISSKKLNMNKISNTLLLSLSFLGLVTTFIEISILHKHGIYSMLEFFLGSILLTIPLFLFCIKNADSKLQIKPLSYIGENLSLMVYIIHPLFIKIMNDIYISYYGNTISDWYKPPIIIAVTLVFSLIYFKITKRIKNKLDIKKNIKRIFRKKLKEII